MEKATFAATLTADYDPKVNRLSVLVRPLASVIVLAASLIIMAFMFAYWVILWLAHLFTGKRQMGMLALEKNLLELLVRSWAYCLLLTDAWPLGDTADFPIKMEVHSEERINYWNLILLRPLLLMAYLTSYVCFGVLVLLGVIFAWFWELIVGRRPDFLWQPILSYLSFVYRSEAYALMLTDEQPVFSHGGVLGAFGLVVWINVIFLMTTFFSEKKVEADIGDLSYTGGAGRSAMQRVEKLSFEDIQAVSAIEEKAAAAEVPVAAEAVGGKPIAVPDEQAEAYREETPTGQTQQGGGTGPVEIVGPGGDVHDADINTVEFVSVDTKAHPTNIDAIKPEFPPMYRDNPLYQTKPVKVSLMVYVGSDGSVKNAVDSTVGQVPKEFKESAREAVESIQWVPAKVNGSPIGTWIAFDVIFRLK
jgi:hypothetical protein